MILTALNERFLYHTDRVKDSRLHYLIGGAGEPVLLWHGFLETWYYWRILLALADHYTAIVPDMRGYRDSEEPKQGYDTRSLAEDFRQLLAQLGFRRIHIAARDIVAPAVPWYAETYPNEVLTLKYLDEPVLTEQNLQQVFKFALDTLQEGGLWSWISSLATSMPESLTARHEREFLTYFYHTHCVDSTALESDVVDEHVRLFTVSNGVRGAPTFFISGIRLQTSWEMTDLCTTIKQAH